MQKKMSNNIYPGFPWKKMISKYYLINFDTVIGNKAMNLKLIELFIGYKIR